MMFPASRHSGSSLITTLMVLAILSMIVIAFLQSMSIERKTAQSYANFSRAKLAAESGQADAINQITRRMSASPYHAIGYTNTGGQIVPILFGSTNATQTPTPYFLISSPTPTNLAATNQTNSTIVNRKLDDGSDWMGSPTNGYRPNRAFWIYLTADPAKPHNANPQSGTNYNPYVSRYAWWVEDETSKLDVLLAGNQLGNSGGFQPPQATNLSTSSSSFYKDAPVVKPSQIDLGAIPILNGHPLATNATATNQTLITFRNTSSHLPPDARMLAQAPGFGTASEKASRFYTTQASVSNDLAGNGRRRVNLNALVHDESDVPNTIASDLDDIAYVISGLHIFPSQGTTGHFHSDPNDSGKALLPNFGERFWPSTDNRFQNFSVSNANKRAIYLTKIAANIRDYIDADSNPTFVDKDGKVVAGPLPAGEPALGVFPSTAQDSSRNGYPQPWAIGKEAIPYLQKYGWYFRSEGSAVTIDQYLTFFNPSTKDFVAPSGTFLRLFKRLRWSTGGFGTRVLSPCEFDLSGATFPAGKAVVICADTAPTSLPGGSYSASLGSSLLRRPIQQCPPVIGQPRNLAEEGTRRFSGVSTATISTYSGGSHDWYGHLMWGNSHGYYGGYSGIGLTAVSNYAANSNQSTGQTMRGNDAGSHSGDVRSLEEPLAISDFYLTGSANGDQDQYRFYSSSSTTYLSDAANAEFIVPNGGTVPWPDYTPQFANNADTAYAVIRDEPMNSIGELGHIYDPYRRNGNNSTGNNNTGYIEYARGGGRTLRIGQPDEVIVNGINSTQQATAASTPRFTPAWANAAWRLTDIFDVLFDSSSGLVDRTTLVAPTQSGGKLNLNSVLRDDGAALRGLLRRFTFLTKPNGAPTTSGRALSESEINTLISQIKTYLITKGPFMERGELSQLLFFATGTAGTTNLENTQDRGREEIFRRILPMLTTRSNSFAIYAVGEAIREDKDGSIHTLGEATRGSVFRLTPLIGPNPLDPVTGYTSQIVYERL